MSSIQLCCRDRVRRAKAFGWLLVGLFLIAGGAGCSRTTDSKSPDPPLSADQVLQEMIATYQQATAYQDDAIVQLSYEREGREFSDDAPLAVTWQKPNQIFVRAYQVEVACDGDRFRAKIKDPSSGNFDGQVVDRVAPQQLLPKQFFEDDEVLSLALRQGLAGNPIQLDLLLSDNPLAVLFEEHVTRRLLTPVTVDNALCYRVAVDSDDGRFVFVIDQQDHLLRRMEYPAEAFAPEIAQDPSVTNVALTVECRGAVLKQKLPRDSFTLKMSSRAKQVSQFIPPPRELPSKLFGTKTAPYSFRALDGSVVSNRSLKDCIKVFVWFNNHPACRSTVQQLNQVYQQYREDARLALFSVCVEPSSVTNQQIKQLTEMWQVEVPVVRDLEAYGRDLFQIPWAPTMVILNEENQVQIVEVGANPNLVAELPQVLERLLAGQDLAGEILAQAEARQELYAKALKQGRPLEQVSETEATLSQRKFSPQLMELRPLWDNTEIQSPGNILPMCEGQKPARFLVLEDGQTVVELNARGQIITRHPLNLPDQDAISQLKTGLQANGERYYVGWSLRGRQVHLFDAQWQPVLSYPDDPTSSEGVQDATLADLDADGQLELYVGFWGNAGVHAVTLTGKVLWSNSDASHVFSLMTTLAGQQRASRLQVTTASGAILAFDHLGRPESKTNHSGQLIHHIFSQPSKQQADVPYCGICYGPEGRRLALGLTSDFESRWRYNLPAGSFTGQIQFVTSAKLFAAASDHWLIAAPDGSVHVISVDGRFTDFFHTADQLFGIAAGRVNSRSMLLLSSQQGVSAWQVTAPKTASKPQPDADKPQ